MRTCIAGSRFFAFFMVPLVFACEAGERKQPNELTDKEKEEGWKLLFDGRTTKGWRGVNRKSFPQKGWEVRDGALMCKGEKGGSIVTVKKYGNFKLKWEWKFAGRGSNSGVKYFVKERPHDTGGHGFGVEYQLVYSLRKNRSSVGCAYALYAASPDRKLNKRGEWNRSKVVSLNGKVEHWLNGKKILEYDRFSDDFKQRVAESKFKNEKNFGRHKKGHILLQDHGSEVLFRNIKILKHVTSRGR